MDIAPLLLSERENPENWEREYRENPDGFKVALEEVSKTHGNLILVRAWKARLVEVVSTKFPRSFWYVMGATIATYAGVAYGAAHLGSVTNNYSLPAMMWIVPFLLHYIWINKKQIPRASYVGGAVMLCGLFLYLSRVLVIDPIATIPLLSLFFGVFALGGFFVYIQPRSIDDLLDVVTRLSSWVLVSLALLIPILGILFTSTEVLQLFGQGDYFVVELTNALVPFVGYYILERSQAWLKISQLYSKILLFPLAVITLFIFFRTIYFLLSSKLGISFTSEFFGVSILLLAMLFIASLIMMRTKNVFSFQKFEGLMFGLIAGVAGALSICAVVAYFDTGSALWSVYPELISHTINMWGLVSLLVYMSVHAGTFAFAALKRNVGMSPSYKLQTQLFLGYPLLFAGIITTIVLALL